MPLPKIKVPVFKEEIPSTGKTITLRPFTVEEEKLFLLATSSDDKEYIIDTIKQVINNCVVDGEIDVDKLEIFDIEYLFIKLRGKSVGNIIEIQKEIDGKIYYGEVDVDKITVIWPDNEKPNLLKVMDNIYVEMKWPDIKLFTKFENIKEGDADTIFKIFSSSITKVIMDDEVYVSGENFDEKEAYEFVMSLPSSALIKFSEFFQNMPKIHTKVTLKTKDGKDTKEIELNGLSDFFT